MKFEFGAVGWEVWKEVILKRTNNQWRKLSLKRLITLASTESKELSPQIRLQNLEKSY